MGSDKFKINTGDLLNVLKNGLLVAVAAFITYIMNNLHIIDLGTYTALVIPIVTLVLDTIVKWAKDNSKEEVKPDSPEGE
ncbi:MAG: hypothetical protein GY810_27970 [Aureispira sp.]|nr:hypothetical protein [Aureispira sp.]|tara:strand:+ start:2708 stop:2947 length:240 start_codon:yes stop_codon:yes gene_type:complete